MLQNNNTHHKWPWRWFQPDYIADSVADIDFAQLQGRGIKAVYVDLDGTVVRRGTYDVSDTITWALRNQPLSVYIATNRPKSHTLKNLRKDLHATGVVHPQGIWCKPFPPYYRQSLKEHGFRPDEAVMVGDRYVQDICGANSAGLSTIVVRKLDQPVNWFDRLLSSFEARRTDALAKRYRPAK